MNLTQSLKKWFGYSSFRAGQREIITALTEGSDVLAMLPTGTGKSICYQLPALMSEGVTVVVSPLLSLMQDQVQELRSKGLKRVAALNSMISPEEKRLILDQLSFYRLLYISPEMLQSSWIVARLQQIRINYFVVDEAHCVSHWGQSFRTDYLKLFEVRQQLGNPPCLAITATATEEVRDDITKHLKLKQPTQIIHSVDRPNITMSVERATSVQEKLDKVLSYVMTLKGPGMVYVQSRKWAEEAAEYLRRNGNGNASHYHGGMVHEDRLLIQQQFMNGQLDLVCCTSAFGMGINKADIRFIIHFHAPLDLESYLQEIGRAGRDGEQSVALLLHTDEDQAFSHAMLQRDQLDKRQLMQVLNAFASGGTFSKEEEQVIYLGLNCSDTAFGTIRFLLEQKKYVSGTHWQSFDAESIYPHVEKSLRLSYNRLLKRLESMWAWVETDICKRKSALLYFGESVATNTKQCCSICGMEMQLFSESTSNETINQNVLNWRKELKQVFDLSDPHET